MPWQVRLVNLLAVLDPKDAFRNATGMAMEDYYNKRLAHGWTLGLQQELKLLQGIIRLAQRPITRQLRQYWQHTRPDMVVSLVPNFNRVMYRALDAARPGVPYVTILTDLADYPPHFWIEPGQPQHLVCGSPKAVAQARAAGYPEERIHPTSGMIIRPDFYADAPVDRRAERRRLGLDPDRVTGIVMFGGHGSKVMQQIDRQLPDTQLILVCGHNRALARRLRATSCAAPRVVLEFSPAIRQYMQLSDFFVGKPGPGSLSEAVQQRLPVIVVRNSWTMPQERYNTDWIREHKLGLVLPSFGGLGAAVQQLTARLDEFAAGVRRIENRAVFEIPSILARILERHQAAPLRHHPAAAAHPAQVSLH